MTAAEVEKEEQAAKAEPETAEEKPEPEAQQEKKQQGRAEPDWDGTAEFRDLRKAFYVQNNFNGGVNAENGVFGMGFGGSMSATSGDLDVSHVAAKLRCFVAPAECAAALDLLRTHHFVVLVGQEGTGRRALALHLLRELCGPDARLVGASPARGLGQLAGMEFARDTGYLVTDHLGTNEEPAVRGFEADRIATACSKQGAYLVLTTTSRRMGELSPYAITVSPPDLVAALHSHLGDVAVEPAVLAMAEEYVRTAGEPRAVAALAERMIDDPACAVEAMRDVPKEQVNAWFDGRVTTPELLSITALTFAGAQPEPTHDQLTEQLRTYLVDAQEQREAAPHVPWHEDVLVQRTRNHPLVTVACAEDLDDEESWLAGRRVRFRHDDHRAHVLRELHDRYGHQLWHPVGNWVRALCRAGVPLNVNAELAKVLAELAKENFTEVRDGYLHDWANGFIEERRTAAMVLWNMSFDDRLAPVALRTALDWGQDNGLNRAVTSALALGGPLGIRFPDEAMQRLCFLALRAKRIGDVARVAIGGLFAVAADEGPAATTRVLATVHTELLRAVDPRGARPEPDMTDTYIAEQLTGSETVDDPDRESYERGWTGRVAKAARSMVLALLSAEQVESSAPVVAHILREQPEHTGVLGVFWAEVLHSSPHRKAAIDALVDTLHALAGDADVLDAVARLGTAIHTALPAPHRRLRARELAIALTTGNQPPQHLVTTLLTALSATTHPVGS